MLKVLWNIVAGLAVLAGIYQGYAAYQTPRAELNLVYGTSSFELPTILDKIFDQLEESPRKQLAAGYAFVAEKSPLNAITYAGLHNAGDKTATDIRVTFPNARLITVRSEGKQVQQLAGESRVIVDKLLPGTSVFFVVWSQRDSDNESVEQISAAHSEGRVELSPRVELPKKWEIISNAVGPVIVSTMLLMILGILYAQWRLVLRTREEKAKDT
jgi:hypothetical protein